jgi:hypothetical protein
MISSVLRVDGLIEEDKGGGKSGERRWGKTRLYFIDLLAG